MARPLFLLPDEAWITYAVPGIQATAQQLAPDLLKLIAPYGDGLGAQLGCGSYGCVWQIVKRHGRSGGAWGHGTIEPSRFVLKISVDATEGPVVQALMNTGLDQELAGLARWEAVRKVQGGIRSGSGWVHYVYVMVREAVDIVESPVWLSREDRDRLSASDPDAFAMWSKWHSAWQTSEYEWEGYNGATSRLMDFAAEVAYDWSHPEVKQLLEERRTWMDNMRLNPMLDFVAEAIDRLSTEGGILVRDIHEHNVGRRIYDWPESGEQIEFEPLPGSPTDSLYPKGWGMPLVQPQYPLLIFDLGHSGVEETDVPALERQVRENPGMGTLYDSIRPL